MATSPAQTPNIVPALSAERPVNWPKRVKLKLANGLEIVVVEAHSIPRFHGQLFFRSGEAAVSHRAPGLAEMTATMVRTGTAKRASRQIEEDLRRLGADLSSSAGQDTSAISFGGLSEFAEPLLALVNELAREASFPEAEFERERRQKLEEVKLERTEPGFLAGERLRKVLYGDHPYAKVSASEGQVAACKIADLQTVYREGYWPANCALLLVVDVEAKVILASFQNIFSSWFGIKPVVRGSACPAM